MLQRTHIIGLVLPQPGHSGSDDDLRACVELAQSVEAAFRDHQRALLISTVTRRQVCTPGQMLLSGRWADGLIMATRRFDDPLVALLQNNRVPLVLIGRNPYYPDAHWVDIDNFQGAALAVTHLIHSGRRRIAMLAQGRGTAAGMDRREGYKQALLRYGLPVEPELIVEAGSMPCAGMRRLLSLPCPPDAIFAASDRLALKAISAIRAAGMRVPDDIAVVGFDDLPGLEGYDPPLTTVRQPMAEIGRQALALLLQVIDGVVAEPQHVWVRSPLVVRASA